MKNRGLKIVGVIAVLVVAVVLIATLTVDEIVKSSIQTKGSEMLQTRVSVNDVHISLFGGTGEIAGLTIENPEGFNKEPAMYVQQADIRLQLMSLFSDEVVIEGVNIQSPEIYFEQQGIHVNLKILHDNIDVSSDEPQKSLVIDHLLIEDIQIIVSTSIDTAEATMESFELEGIGREESNTIKESLYEILDPLLEQAMAKAIEEGLLDQLENKVRDFFDN